MFIYYVIDVTSITINPRPMGSS